MSEGIEEARAALGRGDWPAAARALEGIARAEPGRMRNWTNLSAALRRSGGDPRPALRRAALLSPADTGATNDLGALSADPGIFARRLLVLDPLDPAARMTSALVRLAADEPGAPREFRRVLLSDPQAGEALYHLARLAEPARHPAGALYRRLLVLDPADPLGAGRALARLGLAPPPAAIAPAHVARLFDGYAAAFDRHLTGRLGYRAPEVLARIAGELGIVADRPAGTALDLGCGTGLLGAFFRPLCRRLVGVDLSPAMLAEAERKSLYDALHRDEIVAFLARGGEAFDLLLAGDVTGYIGDLAPLMAAAAGRLAPGGAMLATFLDLAEGDWRLGPDGTFAHGADYVARSAEAAGFDCVRLERGAMREEAGRPVATLFVALRRRSG